MTREAAAFELVQRGLQMMVEGLEKLRTEDDWVDQERSPLGKRAHLEAVRRGDLPGHKVGHSVFVRRADLDAYIQKHPAHVRAAANDQATEDEAVQAAVKRMEGHVAPRRRVRKRSA
jgi:hypothetical protein